MLHMVTDIIMLPYFFLKYSISLILAGLAEAWGIASRGRLTVGEIYMCVWNLFRITTVFSLSYAHFRLSSVQKAR